MLSISLDDPRTGETGGLTVAVVTQTITERDNTDTITSVSGWVSAWTNDASRQANAGSVPFRFELSADDLAAVNTGGGTLNTTQDMRTGGSMGGSSDPISGFASLVQAAIIAQVMPTIGPDGASVPDSNGNPFAAASVVS
jgi:hypothetical protein